MRALDRADASGDASDADRELRTSLAEGLHAVVAGMNEQNFLVRPHRRLVERFAGGDAWQARTDELTDAAALADLPSAALAADTDERAKRFDLLVLRAQLGVVAADPGFAAARDRIRAIAAALGEQRGIPAIARHLELIDAVAGVDWWQDVTLPMLELVRTRLRPLVRLIEVTPRSPMFTDFEDVLESPDAAVIVIDDPGRESLPLPREALRLPARTREPPRARRSSAPASSSPRPTSTSCSACSSRAASSRHPTSTALAAAVEEADGLGLFVRSIVGLDRSAAQDALSEFVADRNLSSRQISFVDLIVTELSRTGSVPIRVLYDPPFDAIAPTGPEDVFTEAEIIELEQVLDAVAATARPLRSA